MYIYANFSKINSNSIKILSLNLKMDITLAQRTVSFYIEDNLICIILS